MPADYQVRLDVFQGPLDLLLFLVRRDEVELYDLSLERLIQQYLDYLAGIPAPDLERAGEFIAMAAHLIYLKSRRLLPPDQQPAVEDVADEEDPHFELIRQLIEYKKFKDAARHLQGIETVRFDLFPRPPAETPDATEAEELFAGTRALRDVGMFDLLNAFERVLARIKAGEEKEKDHTVIFEENFTVGRQILFLRELAASARGEAIAFSSLFAKAVSRVEVVVTFLALLELVRLKVLRVAQTDAFQEILIFEQPTVKAPESAPEALEFAQAGSQVL